MKQQIRLLFLLPLFSLSFMLEAQHYQSSVTLDWKGILTENFENGKHAEYLYFTGSSIDPAHLIPVYTKSYPSDFSNPDIQAILNDTVWMVCNAEENQWLEQQSFNNPDFKLHTQIVFNRKKPECLIRINPIRYDAAKQTFEKLIRFTINLNLIQNTTTSGQRAVISYAEHSVLSTGQWAKIRVKASAIYKISYYDLIAYGFEPATISPDHIQLFGNAGGMLPEKNSTFRFDDLVENAIYIEGGDDGSFDPQDYILFYGMSPNVWQNILGFLLVQPNYYTDYNYYFLTVSNATGKRMDIQNSEDNYNYSVNYFNDFQYVEQEDINLILSGKTWYGDEFGITNSRSYSFNFPEILMDKNIVIKTSVANRTFENDELVVTINNDTEETLPLIQVDPSSTTYAKKKRKTITTLPTGPEVNVKLDYYPSGSASRMWLDYINVNAISLIQVDTGQLLFRELHSVNDGAVTRFTIENSNPQTQVLEVTNPLDVHRVETSYENGQTYFTLQTDSLREFIAYDGSRFLTPEWVGSVANQDIHGEEPMDMVIVTHPLFFEQANRLKNLHDSIDGIKSLIVTPEEVYNEFSSGKQDPTAIRDMMKMFYDKNPGNEPRYLLLFGDGSFDPKDRIENNSNFVPTFQTEESWTEATSYVIDDYFGLLDDDEGDDAYGVLDLGIGRFPVRTEEEAKLMVDKVYDYLTRQEPQYGNWRNTICIIADDEDSNLHLQQADSLASPFGYIPNDYNINKIYLDSYKQESTPSGDKYPAVTQAINQQVTDGALFINYVGHGGIGGWAHERIMQQNDFLSWSNEGRLPVFVTATCEFSRFDDPEIVSGGELVILNPKGGGIALFTTTRLAYSQSNFRLNERMLSFMFVRDEQGDLPRMGDLIRHSKPPGQLTTRNFVLLGDPALQLAYPQYRVSTSSVNGASVNLQLPDTIRALQKVTISGTIEDVNGNKLENFNGFILPTVYDKLSVYNTIANDPASFITSFVQQDKIIWQGRSNVSGGNFTFSFVVPKDIAMNYGFGKISYYAFSENSDAAGSYSNLVIGGLDEQAETDLSGPDIQLYMNNTAFVSGDQTQSNPILLAFLEDEHGINLSSNGMGHEIVMLLNDDYPGQMVMNDYFVCDENSYKKGSIEYAFDNLPDGSYTLQLKAWDTYNNSSTKSIRFVINTNATLWLSQVKTSPNPFSEKTNFSFKHTRPGDKLNVALQIYNLFGKHILSYNTEILTDNAETSFFTWNGTDAFGAKVSSGVYIYRIQVNDESGTTSVQQQKLILR